MRSADAVAEVVLFLLALPVMALAHASGAGGVDQYIRLLPGTNGIQVELDIHFGELASAVLSAQIDTNADGDLSQAELRHFLKEEEPTYLNFLSLTAQTNGGTPQALELSVPANGPEKTWIAYCPPGDMGQLTIRIICLFEARWPKGCEPLKTPVIVQFQTYVPYRCNRSIVYVEPETPLAVIESDVSSERQHPRPPDIIPPIKDKPEIPVESRARIVIGAMLQRRWQ